MNYGWLEINHRGGTQHLPIVKSTLTIGRAGDNDLVLNSTSVSPHHAQIVVDGACQIMDMSSANGTFLDGNRIPSFVGQPLREGSTIKVGATRIIVHLTPDASEPAAPTAAVAPGAPLPCLVVAALPRLWSAARRSLRLACRRRCRHLSRL